MKAKDKFRATWCKKWGDILLHYPLGIGTRSDGHWLSGWLNKEFTDELTDRGYDVTTIKFSIQPTKGNVKFVSQRGEAT